MSTVTFTVNGSSTQVDRSARRLSDVLRDHLALTATKVGCDAGDCGACTVLAGRRTGDRVHDVGRAPRRSAGGDPRGPPRERRGHAAAGRVPRARRRAVRHLHARHAGVGGGAPASHVHAHRAAGHGRPRRCAVPLHRLPQDRRRGHGRACGRHGHRAVAAAGRQGGGSPRPAGRRPTQGERHRRLRRRRGARRSAHDPHRPLSPPPGELPARRHRRLRRGDAGRRGGADRGRRRGQQPVRRDPRHGRSARVRRGTRPVPRRSGGHDRGRTRADGGVGPLHVPGDVGGVAAAHVHRRSAGARTRPGSTTTARATSSSAATWHAAISTRPSRRPPSRSRACSRPASSSMPTSSRRPATPNASATASRCR